MWCPRKHGTAIGRMYTISPRQGECYYLRLLLTEVTGPQSFDDLKRVDDTFCATYREACQLRGLLEDDRHLQHALQEASVGQSAYLLRNLFAIILTACMPANPLELWSQFKEHFAYDFLHQHRQRVNDYTAEFSPAIYNLCLCAIEDKLTVIGGLNLEAYGLPKAERGKMQHMSRQYWREVNYNTDELTAAADARQQQLTADQREVYAHFMDMVDEQQNGSPIGNNVM